MNKKVKPENLGKEIASILKEFQGVTAQAAEAGVRETAEEVVKDLRSAHPSGSGVYSSWDKYNAGWTATDQRKWNKGFLSIVHNKTKYQIAHLLEKGHAKTNGGRTRAFPHIAPAADKADRMLIENIKKRIEHG